MSERYIFNKTRLGRNHKSLWLGSSAIPPEMLKML